MVSATAWAVKDWAAVEAPEEEAMVIFASQTPVPLRRRTASVLFVVILALRMSTGLTGLRVGRARVGAGKFEIGGGDAVEGAITAEQLAEQGVAVIEVGPVT